MKKKLKIKVKNNPKNHKPIIFFAITVVLLAAIGFFEGMYFLFEENILTQKGLISYQNGQYKNAERYYNADTALQKLFAVTLKATKDKDFYAYFESKEEMIKCLIERGNISKAIKEYKKFLAEVQTNCPHDEDMSNLINLQIANCYATIGLYNKAIPIYEKLQNWYPQNLIQAYIDTKNYEKASAIINTDEIRAKIEEGEDSDAIALGYTLLNYYKAIGRYDLACKNYTKEAPSFETDIISALNLADLNYLQKNYAKSQELFEELLTSAAFSQNTRHKIQLKYANLLYESGKSYQAEKAIEDIFKEQKELFELSPEIICTNYTASKIFEQKSKNFANTAQKKFDRLKLPAESLFYNDLDYFCKINTRY